MRDSLVVAGLSAVLATVVAPAVRASEEPPRLFRNPALSRSEVAFSYAGDLWTAPRAGGDARRLTASPGVETAPVFSPDGASIAFTGNYDGNVDVYVMPAAGGEPRRLTHHPRPDHAVAFTPDGAEVVFRTDRDNGLGHERLFAVPVAGGFPRRLPFPEAFQGSYAPDGKRFAYMPHQRFQLSWKKYRGGETTAIWIADLATLAVEAVPRQNSNDSHASWAADGRVYFLSDRGGPVTLYRYDTATRAVEPVLANDGLDLRNASAGPGAIVFERFGQIGIYDVSNGQVSWPRIRVASDLESVRPRFVKVGDALEGHALSPSGARVAFSARGEILTVPAKKGDVRNITNSPGAADRDPAWSPDGQSLAWLSDQSGEYALHVASQSGLGPVRRIPLGDPPSFFYEPIFSPDGKQIALYDKRLQLWTVEVAAGTAARVDRNTYDTPFRTFDPAWSPDSRHLAYTKRLPSGIHALFLHEVARGATRQVTDGLADVRYPAFDAAGKLLWFTASTDFGPSVPWLDMTSVDRPVTRSVFAMVLPADEPSPFGPQSDEEEAKQADAEAKAGAKAGKPEARAVKPPVVVRIDFDGLPGRIVPVPKLPVRNYVGLFAGKAGELFLREAPIVAPPDADDAEAGPLHRYVVADRKAEKLADDVSDVQVSADGAKLLVRLGKTWAIVDASKPIPEGGGEGKLATDTLEVRVDPRAEWRQMYREAWRLERDFFYDPGFHGLDLATAEKRYASYLDGLAHRDELNELFVEMLGNLSVGHMYVQGGDAPKAREVKGGLLGADWEVADGRYRIARVLGSEVWNPELQAPLAQPGVGAKSGEYLISVEGREARPPASVHAFFEGRAGQAVRLRLAADAEGKAGARDVTVVPVDDERALRYRTWVEDNRRAVERLSGGRLGYVHLPNTGQRGYQSFNRYFFSQLDREGMVVDERDNGGGLVADYMVDVLARRTPRLFVATREGADFASPAGALYGPKVMLINRHAGSGGDALPWLFREMGLGPLVGTRTWGGLVGIWDYPRLVDGGRVTAPRGALYGPRGQWEIENRGVAPDVEVEVMPQDFAAGRDPQLEKAVELLLAELARNPRQAPRRPPYPNYQVSPWSAEVQQ